MEAVNFYPHKCTITRSTGTTDELGNEIFETLYDGSACLQRGGAMTVLGGGMVYYDQPLVVIPKSLVDARVNDNAIVVDELSRIYRYVVEQAEPIQDDEIGGCNVWMKKGDSR